MGRPLNKRWFGDIGTGTGTGLFTGNNLPIRFKTDGTVYEGYIQRQVGARTFVCLTNAPSSPPMTVGTRCKLVQGTNSDPVNNSEATLVGMLNGSPVTLQKLTNRIATDYNGVRYTWTLTDDSSQTLLILTSM
jgi:hypothetical protein